MSNFEIGDIVLVVDENSPRNLWPLGRILEVKPNKGDGLVRTVSLKTCSPDTSHRQASPTEELTCDVKMNSYLLIDLIVTILI